MLRVLCALVLAGWSFSAGAPALAQTADRGAIEDIIDAALADGDVPGAIVLVELGGERLVIARGLANRETGLTMARHHLLRIASVGKLHTAAVIHRLAMDGHLSLDAPVSAYLEPRWTDGVANAAGATVRQLLSHTSGIPDYYDETWFATVDETQLNSAQRTLAHVRGRPPAFEAGQEHGYSNTNYQYLGLIAEAVGGRPLAQIYADEVFVPLELEQSGYNIQFAPGDVIHGYGNQDDPEADAYRLQENNGPDGGVFTTADELADTLNGLFADEGALAALGEQMLSDLFDRGEGRYRGLGPSLTRTPDGLEIITHGGSIAGYATIAVREQTLDLVIIAHLNRDRPDLAGRIVRQTFGSLSQ